MTTSGILRAQIWPDVGLQDISDTVAIEQTAAAVTSVFPTRDDAVLAAIKTNVLYDFLATPNISVEFPVGRSGRWSTGLDYKFPWWVFDNNSRCWQALHLDVFVRYWFGDRLARPDLTGHFIGISGGTGLYDIEPHHKGYQGEFWTASLEYGRSWQISGRWKLETSIAAGWMSTGYDFYEGVQQDKHLVYKYSGRYMWLGPTKLNVSFAYSLFKGRKNRREEIR